MPPQTIPTLTSERLILRVPVAGDFPAYALLLASPRAKYLGGHDTRRAAWGLFCHDIACWELFGHGGLMIEPWGTGECVGQVGINHRPLFPEKELGWQVYEGREGQGYATEGAMIMRDWAAHTLRLRGLGRSVHPRNYRSAAVAERLGAILDPDAPRQDRGDLVCRHLHPRPGT